MGFYLDFNGLESFYLMWRWGAYHLGTFLQQPSLEFRYLVTLSMNLLLLQTQLNIPEKFWHGILTVEHLSSCLHLIGLIKIFCCDKHSSQFKGLMPEHLRITTLAESISRPLPQWTIEPINPTSFQISTQTSQQPLIGPLLPRYSTCSRDWAVFNPVRIRCQWYQGISSCLLSVIFPQII